MTCAQRREAIMYALEARRSNTRRETSSTKASIGARVEPIAFLQSVHSPPPLISSVEGGRVKRECADDGGLRRGAVGGVRGFLKGLESKGETTAEVAGFNC